MVSRFAPQRGSGRSTKCRYAFTRKSRIHSGSDLCSEIWRTMSSVSPRPVENVGVKSSWKPYLYSPI
jgi:hypothetical protein